MSAMTQQLRVLSVYEGFFAGGARILHSRVLASLHGRAGQHHSVLSIHREMRRESLHQTMTRDASYRLLRAAGLRVSTLGRTADAASDRNGFTLQELEVATRHLAETEVVLSLKEQPLRLVCAPGLPHRPVVVCLHRSDLRTRVRRSTISRRPSPPAASSRSSAAPSPRATPTRRPASRRACSTWCPTARIVAASAPPGPGPEPGCDGRSVCRPGCPWSCSRLGTTR